MMTRRAPARLLRAAALFAPLLLPGCGALISQGASDLAGVAGAGAASAVTRDATVAAAIGLGVRSVAAETLKYAQRHVHRNEQDAIAAAAGPLEPGAIARWSISHTIPLEPDARGDVTVSRVFGAGAIQCKEVVFSVETKRRRVTQRAFFITTVCRDGATWRWASAEPATDRWGSLQ